MEQQERKQATVELCDAGFPLPLIDERCPQCGAYGDELCCLYEIDNGDWEGYDDATA